MAGTPTIAGAIAVLALVAACGSTPAVTSSPTPTGGGTATAAATTPAPPPTGTTAPNTIPPSGGVTGHECAAFPTMDPTNPNFSFAPDPTIEAHFPAAIDGEPLRDVESGSFLQTLCLGGQAIVDQIRGQAQFDLTGMTFYTAEATVDGEDVKLQAFRAPGQTAGDIVQSLLAMAQQSSTTDIGTISQGTAGGKSVIVVTDPDGKVTYAYGVGDTLIFVEDITQSQADKIFAVIQ